MHGAGGLEDGRLLRSASLKSMTEHSDTLMLEVDDGGDCLADRLVHAGLAVRRKDKMLMVRLTGDETFDVIRDTVADLDLSLHRLEQHRHQVADLFRDEPSEAEHVV